MQKNIPALVRATFLTRKGSFPIIGKITLSLLMLFSITGCTVSSDDKLPADIVTVGSPLPQFTVTLNDGGTFATNTATDSASVFVFFNTECKDCQRELPIVQRVFAETKGAVRFLCISRAEADSSVAAYWAKNAFTLPYSAQPDRGVYSLFANRTIPRIYISDTLGVVRTMFVEKAGYEALRRAVEAVTPEE